MQKSSALREEIANGLISRRDIERYCDDDWKKKTRPKKENDKLSFSRHEQQAIPLMIDIDGNSVTEQAAISSSDSSNNDAVNSEGSGNEEVKYVEEFNAGNELEDAIRIFDNEVQQKALSVQGRVKEIDSNIERINTDLEIKSNENYLQPKVKDLTASLDIQFEVQFEHLRKHMESCCRKHITNIWFFAKVDPVTKNVSDVQFGLKTS